MMLFFKMSIFLFLATTAGCDSAKSAATNEQETKAIETMDDSKLVADGYILASVKYQEDSKCSYILVDEKKNLMYDPINFDAEKFASFKSNDAKVYVKFRGLRMPNRCPNIQPVELTEIKAGT